jgi:hypothetical protein
MIHLHLGLAGGHFRLDVRIKMLCVFLISRTRVIIPIQLAFLIYSPQANIWQRVKLLSFSLCNFLQPLRYMSAKGKTMSEGQELSDSCTRTCKFICSNVLTCRGKRKASLPRAPLTNAYRLPGSKQRTW